MIRSRIINWIDAFLYELGTASLIDGDRVRNELLDLRSTVGEPEDDE